MQSTAIVSENIKPLKKKKITTKDMLETGVKSIVGINLTSVAADFIEGY